MSARLPRIEVGGVLLMESAAMLRLTPVQLPSLGRAVETIGSSLSVPFQRHPFAMLVILSLGSDATERNVGRSAS